MKGEYDAALEAINAETRDGFQSAGRALVYHALGNSERAQTELDELIALGNVWTYEIAMVHAYRGDLDEAFAWLERAIERRDTALGFLVADPFMANLHDDSRFDLVVDRIGMTAYWERRKSARASADKRKLCRPHLMVRYMRSVDFLQNQLAANIIRVLDTQKLSVLMAATRTGFDYADFSRIRNVEFGRFTIDRPG